MNFEPNVGKALIQLETETGRTAGGLYIPQSAASDGVKLAVVKAVGIPRLVEGKPTALQLCVGDRVLVDPLGGLKLKVNGEDCILIRAEDVLGRVN